MMMLFLSVSVPVIRRASPHFSACGHVDARLQAHANRYGMPEKSHREKKAKQQ